MKFLVSATPRRLQIPTVGLIDQIVAWVNAKVGDKTIDCIYSYITGGGVGIFNADSADAMMQLLLSYPGYALADFKVEALCDMGGAMQQVKAMVQRSTAG